MSLVWSYDVHTTYYYKYIPCFYNKCNAPGEKTHPFKSHSHIIYFILLRLTTNKRHCSMCNPSTCVHVIVHHVVMHFLPGFIHAYNGFENASWSMYTESRVSDPLTTSISKTKMGHENISGRLVRYNIYNLYRITLFCNTN